METKKIVFVTGTRADFGKLKSLITKIDSSKYFECHIFITGMHTLSKYGLTINEIKKMNYKNIYPFSNQSENTDMDIVLSNTILGFSNYIKELKPDIIVVHGDRVEALAGAIVGALNNILIAHIEGGEVSGTVDELLRHAITKMSHIHFVANEEAKQRLLQMGEDKKTVFIVGSPDLDIMKSKLPSLEFVKKHYKISFKNYSIFCYHPSELNTLEKDIKQIISALIKSRRNYVVIYPNNDSGSQIILNEIKTIESNNNFRVYPSLRFEYFLVLLKNADFIIGNSSAGIREAGFYKIPCINIGSRQENRSRNKQIINIEPVEKNILFAIDNSANIKIEKSMEFGEGNSTEMFFNIMVDKSIWRISHQKQFKLK